jgi:hypothetical protein
MSSHANRWSTAILSVELVLLPLVLPPLAAADVAP